MTKSSETPARAQAKPFEFHPFADVFPLMKGKEFAELVADIRDHGLNDQIVTFEGKVLDGRNRDRGCAEAGVKPRYHPFQGTEADARAFVISANIRRRHLDPAEKRRFLKKVIALDPKKSDRQIGKETGVDHKTIAKARNEGESTGEVSPVGKRRGADGKTRRRPVRRKGKTVPRAAPTTSPAAPTTSPAAASTQPAAASATSPATTAPTTSPAAVSPAQPANTDKPSYRELEIQIEGFKSEIEDLQAKLKVPLSREALIDALVAFVTPLPHGERKTAINNLMTTALKHFAASIDEDASITTGKWEINFKQYPKGWWWSATNGNASISSNPAALFATREEAEADARAAIARKDNPTELAEAAAAEVAA
jgi:hypothetical protein